MKSYMGIRARLIAGIVVVTAAAMGFVGVLSISALKNSAYYSKVNEAARLARVVSSVLNDPAYAGGEYAAAGRVKAIMRDAGMTSIYVTGPAGKVILSEGKLPGDPGIPIIAEEGVRIYRVSNGNEDFIYAKVGDGAGVLAPGGAGRGGFQAAFTISMSDTDSYLARMKWFLAAYALAFSVIIIGFGAYFLSLLVVSPVKRLEAAAKRISSGELDVRASIEGYDEIASLGAAFNAMATRLAEEIRRLEGVNSELIGAREELLRAETLAAMGRLAAGVAHEIGNPLGAISGYVGLLKKDIKDEHCKEMLVRAEKEIHRIDRVVKEFLELARPSARPASEVDVNASVGETVALLKAHKDFERTRVEFALKEVLPPVIINEEKLRQVFINLLLNAAWATGGQGVITITTALEAVPSVPEGGRRRSDSVFGGAPASTPCGAISRDTVIVSFKDTGRGIGKDDLERVFEPFFSTREGGGGLGLFVSQGIITHYGGRIEAESKEG
ncbi:MAG: ATP-binding protein, partial [Deltaproteobacteria bacterium]